MAVYFKTILARDYTDLSKTYKQHTRCWIDEVRYEFDCETIDGDEFVSCSEWTEEEIQDHCDNYGYLFDEYGRNISGLIITELEEGAIIHHG